MIYRLLADAVAVAHAAFVAFVVFGGLLVMRWRRIAWLHIPAALWGVLVEYRGWVCPLTPLENMLRERAGLAGYSGGFVDHYILRLLYPSHLTQDVQWILGTLALAMNALVYGAIWRQRRRARRLSNTTPLA
jgi:hypothetical protein